MTNATIEVTIPDSVWVSQVSRRHETVTFEVVAAVPGREAGYALVRIVGEDIDPVFQDMTDHPQLASVSVIQESDHSVLAQFESTKPLLLFSSRDAGVPIKYPVTVTEGRATIEIAGARDQIAAFTEMLDSRGITYQIEYIKETAPGESLLTDHQRTRVAQAIAAGYYDTPRTCSLTELADQLGIAKSTCSETLHRAEAKILKEYVDDHDLEYEDPAAIAVE